MLQRASHPPSRHGDTHRARGLALRWLRHFHSWKQVHQQGSHERGRLRLPQGSRPLPVQLRQRECCGHRGLEQPEPRRDHRCQCSVRIRPISVGPYPRQGLPGGQKHGRLDSSSVQLESHACLVNSNVFSIYYQSICNLLLYLFCFECDSHN
jgi:hypothetical protein